MKLGGVIMFTEAAAQESHSLQAIVLASANFQEQVGPACYLGSLPGFPGGTVGKESACNAGDPSLIAGSRRSTREGIGYPLQYSGLENSMDYSPRGCKESDTTERLSLHFTCLTASMGRIPPPFQLPGAVTQS